MTDRPGLSLRGRTVMITGGARGIGAATARLMAEAGARVAMVDREGGSLERTLDEVRRAGGEGLAFTEDVRDAAAMERVAARMIEEWGRIDVLVNNAGIVRDARLSEVTDADWQETLDVNLRGAMICARAVAGRMKAGGFGRLLSATSVVARMGNFGQTAYAASKAGIVGMTRSWARELGPHGITANAVAPGFIDTDMVKGVPAKVVELMVGRTAARRLGRAEEVAAVYLFLASDLASFINGAVIGVDGGLLL